MISVKTVNVVKINHGCILSAYTCLASIASLGLTGLYDRFDGHIFSATEVPNGKSAPDLFLYAAKKMGVSPADCVVIEHSALGVKAARAAGMRVFANGGRDSGHKARGSADSGLHGHAPVAGLVAG